MADPRLTWRNVAAPDLSPASAALARAGESINRGVTTVSNLLTKYQEGAQEKADNQLLADMAGLKSEEDLDNFINNGGLRGRNISDSMRDYVAGARTNFLNQQGKRLSNNAASARIASAAAASRRAASAASNKQARQNELNNLSSLIVQASLEGNQLGKDRVDAQGNPVARPAFDALAAGLANSQHLNPQDINDLLGSSYTAMNKGQERIDRSKAIQEDRVINQALIDAYSNPTIRTPEDAIRFGLSNASDIDNDTRLELTNRLSGLVGDNQGYFNPQGTPNAVIDSTVQAEQARMQRQVAANPTTTIMEREKDFRDNPAKSVADNLNLFKDDESSSSWLFGLVGEDQDQQVLDKFIRDGAKRTNVSPSTYASAMVETFQRDPFGTNTNDRRFNVEVLDKFVKDNLSETALRSYDDQRIRNQNRRAQFDTAQVELQTLRSQAARYSQQGRTVPASIQSRINRLEGDLGAGATPQEVNQKLADYVAKTGMASRLEGLSPDSAEFHRAILELREVIRRDNTLSDREKVLLIESLQG